MNKLAVMVSGGIFMVDRAPSRVDQRTETPCRMASG
jgi:hypothetical protein